MPYVRLTRRSLHTPVLIAAALRLALADAPAAAQAAGSRGTRPPTVAGAAAFMARAESVFNDLAVKAERADWVANTYITFDTEELTAQAQEAYGVATRDLATQARRYERLPLPPDLKRKFLLLKLSLPAPPPPDAREAAELTRLTSSMQADYGKGTYCRNPQDCLQLHAYVRARLVEKYGAGVVPPNGMIPAHLLGNLWAQQWDNVYDLVAPSGVPPSVDVGGLLVAHRVDERGMVRYAERFYTSLGFDSLPATFWERSMITKPRDRDVVCHASAGAVVGKNDIRVKMCMRVTGEDFVVIHHELGHDFYERAYKAQPYLFQSGANDGFHEAIGDAIALSVTPEYLQRIGLLDSLPSAASDTAMLLRIALAKIAFLPFGLGVDRWRWGVFAGDITPDHYNAAWWDLKHRYQGVAEPVARSERDFDPAAKYHVAANVPYIRYFIARILQFQFHRSWCRAAGWTGPLYRCSVYGNAAAGRQLARMLAAGQSKPWQEILSDATGERQMDATAMVDYFHPLVAWLERQNQGKPVGW